MHCDGKLRNGAGDESAERGYGKKIKRDGKKERRERRDDFFFLTPTVKGEAGRRGRYRPGINRDQNRVTEKRERTAAAAAAAASSR